MNAITLAQTTLVVNNLRLPVLWTELDRAIQKLHGQVVVHSVSARDYRLSAIELRVLVTGQVLTTSWVSRSPVLDSRGRIDLRQSADAWMDTLATLAVRPAAVWARVQAAPALLSAGFESVSVSITGLPPIDGALPQALAA